MKKPYLFTDGSKALVITAINPNSPQGGSSNIIRNFLDGFDSSSYLIATSKPRGQKRSPLLPTEIVITDFYKYRKPIQWLLGPILRYRDAKRLKKVIINNNIKNILLVYPHLYNIEVFLSIKISKSLQLVGYFHDTFIEGQLGRVNKRKLDKLHSTLLNRLDKLFVMNEGMCRLYKSKYNKDSISLEHTYPEYNKQSFQKRVLTSKKIFWGGNILGYNAKSLKRIIQLANAKGFKTEIATRQNKEAISNLLNGISVDKTFYSDREKYLEAIKNSSFLILALNWPDETDYHFDEISTIFSTKAIEYLMSGVPIILHAPHNYFLSEFIIENNCGYVIDTREEKEMLQTFDQLLQSDHSSVIEQAIITAQKFNPVRIRQKWIDGTKDLI